MLVTNILLVSAILLPSYITIRSYLSESAEAYTTALLNEKVNKLEQDFKETSKLVNVLNIWIAEAFDFDRGLSDTEYMSEFREVLIRQFKGYLGQNKFNTSLYIYFNYDLFNAEYDVWYNRIEGNKYELQPKLGNAYFEDYHAWYNEPIDNGVALWTKPYTAINGPFSGKQLTSYVSPVMIDNKTVAVIGVDLYIDEIIEIVKDLKLYDTGYVYVLQEDGHVLYHPYLDVDQVYADSETSRQLLEAFNTNPSGILTYFDDNGDKIYSAYGHLENGWLLATHVPEKEVFSKLSELLNVLIIFILITMLVILIITNLIVIRIFKPITDLTEEMSILDSGNLKKGISSKLLEDDTEIGILANEVDNMRLRLLESFSRIEKYNDELESIVDHRTKDLKNALEQVRENQHAVIELERNKGMSVLMKNLAHRLNTP
jgi:methyl-accepting chemotaxis protein